MANTTACFILRLKTNNISTMMIWMHDKKDLLCCLNGPGLYWKHCDENKFFCVVWRTRLVLQALWWRDYMIIKPSSSVTWREKARNAGIGIMAAVKKASILVTDDRSTVTPVLFNTSPDSSCYKQFGSCHDIWLNANVTKDTLVN